MPELPEVETTVRELRRLIVGQRITDAWTDWPRIVRHGGSFEAVKKRLIGKRIAGVRRRAKYIIIDLSGPESLFVHQKISGHLLYGKWRKQNGTWRSIMAGPLQDDPDNRFIRLLIFFRNGKQLALSDQRRFGKIMLIDDEQIARLPELRRLGPEPLQVTEGKFAALFAKKRGRIKQVLLDPFFIAGIGNIYADEILWDTGIHPLSRTEHLKKDDIGRLFRATGKILKKAIAGHGSSIDDYRTPSGGQGGYQNVHKAYQRTGQKCSRRDGGNEYRSAAVRPIFVRNIKYSNEDLGQSKQNRNDTGGSGGGSFGVFCYLVAQGYRNNRPTRS
jgi:formamidopyrimidine-DNA glycosylase